MALRRVSILSLLLAFCCTSPARMLGQASTTGELTGTVTDPSGAVLAGAALTITQPDTGFSRTATSNSSPDRTSGQP
jgi:hypothetical protein